MKKDRGWKIVAIDEPIPTIDIASIMGKRIKEKVYLASSPHPRFYRQFIKEKDRW